MSQDVIPAGWRKAVLSDYENAATRAKITAAGLIRIESADVDMDEEGDDLFAIDRASVAAVDTEAIRDAVIRARLTPVQALRLVRAISQRRDPTELLEGRFLAEFLTPGGEELDPRQMRAVRLAIAGVLRPLAQMAP